MEIYQPANLDVNKCRVCFGVGRIVVPVTLHPQACADSKSVLLIERGCPVCKPTETDSLSGQTQA